MTKKLLVLAVILTASQAFAANMSGTRHDLSSGTGLAVRGTSDQVCVYCHTPHNGSNAGAPLWNRSTPATAYQMYNAAYSPTIDMTVAATPGAVSKACLSCHDGSIALGALLNLDGAVADLAMTPQGAGGAKGTYTGNNMSGGSPFIGSDLRNDHPVAITYDNTAAGDTAFVAAVAGKVGTLPLYGAGADQVECATCHNPHATTANFLRVANTGSALCTTCHVK